MTPEEEAKAVELAEEIKAWLQKYYESRRALDTLVESTRRLVVEHERKVARLEQERDEAWRKALEEAGHMSDAKVCEMCMGSGFQCKRNSDFVWLPCDARSASVCARDERRSCPDCSAKAAANKRIAELDKERDALAHCAVADKSPLDLAREMLALSISTSPSPWRRCGNGRGVCPCASVWSVPLDVAVHQPGLGGVDDERRPDAKCQVADAAFIAFARNNAEAICKRLMELEEQIGDPEILACFRRQEALDATLAAASYEGSNALMRAALGELYSQLWGPALERLGMAIDVVTGREKQALARNAKLERVAEAAKEVAARIDDIPEQELDPCERRLFAALADLEKP